MKTLLRATLFFAPLLLSICSIFNHYEYTPPTSLEGRKCITHCLSDKQRCESNAELLFEKTASNKYLYSST